MFPEPEPRDASTDSAAPSEPRNAETPEPSPDRRGVLRLLRTRAAEAEAAEERNPYPGLAPFTEREAGLFFGREGEAEALWERIRARRLLTVIGPSGAGKTSFLRAGVIPSRPEGWGAAYATPGANPALGLARALTPELAGDAEAVDGLLGGVAELSRSGDTEPLIEAVRRWRSRHGEVLLVFDQFEELFTLNPPEVRSRIAGLVEALAYDADVHVVLSLRDDFLMSCCEEPPLAPILNELTALLPLKHAGLRRALEEPAARQGYRFEDDELVEEIVGAVEGERGSLPPLAFAVSRLWERRDPERRLLTREAYLEIGGVEGALARHAEATLERIGEERQAVVREIFRNLVTSQGTRAVMEREELLSAFPERRTAEEALGLLVDARLLTTYEVEGREGKEGFHRVEVAHESLLKAWPRLVRWRAQDEEGAVLRDQLRQAAHLWEEKGRTEDLLWTGTAYREFALWRERYPGALTAVEEDFARAMADRTRRRRRARLAVVGVVIVGLIAVTGTVTVLWRQALTAAQHSEASKLLAIAQLKLEGDPTEALAYATASLELSDSGEARVFVVKTLAEGPPVIELAHDFGLQRAPAFGPDGTQLAVAGHTDVAVVWRNDGTLVALLPGLENSGQGSNLAQWAGSNSLVTGLCCGLSERVRAWALPGGREIRTIDFGMPRWWQVGGNRLLTSHLTSEAGGGQFMHLKSWRLSEGTEHDLGSIECTELGTCSGLFTPDGGTYLYGKGDSVFLRQLPLGGSVDRVLSRLGSTLSALRFPSFRKFWARDADGLIRAWTFEGSTFENPVDISKPETAAAIVDLDASGRWVFRAGGNHQDVQVWSLSALPGSRPLTLRRNSSWYASILDVHPTGDWLVCTTDALTRLTFWPLHVDPPSIVDGYHHLTRPIAFSPDSRWLASDWRDGLRLWPVPGGTDRTVRILDAPQDVPWGGLVFDPTGRFLFATSMTGDACVVPLDGTPAQLLEGFSKDAFLGARAISPSGRRLAAATLYGEDRKELRVWDLETGAVRVFPLPDATVFTRDGDSGRRTGYEAGVSSLLFDGESVLYTAGHGGIRRWDLESGSHSLLEAGPMARMYPRSNGFEVLATFADLLPFGPPLRTVWLDLRSGVAKPADEWVGILGETVSLRAGAMLVAAGSDGLVRLARLGGGAPHIPAGHVGSLTTVAVSPDLKWVASTGEDNTLRLWPMPDLSKPPLHTLPHDELIAKLKSLTNLRAVRDPEAEGGWKIDLAPFPGWKDVPTW